MPLWKPYRVLLDYNYDGILLDPRTGELVEGKRILIWSPGPDGKSGTAEADLDNNYSW